MSYKFKHSFAAALAVVLVVGFLPINALVVRADENDVYYIYTDETTYETGIAKEIPDNAYKTGVFVNGGSYDLQDDDYTVWVNKGTVYTTTDDILFGSHNFRISDSGKVASDELEVTSREGYCPEYTGDIDYETIDDYFYNQSRSNIYTFISDYRYSTYYRFTFK